MKKRTLVKIGVTLAAITTAIHTLNKVIEKQAVKKGLLSRTEKLYYNWKLGRICYTVYGVGSPVLLVHDSVPWSGMHEWEKIKKHLSREHTVFCIDLLGCGNSDHPKMTYTNYVYVQLLTDFIEHVIQEKTDVVANGLSGAHVLMACKNNANIGKVILIQPQDLAVLGQTPTPLSKAAKYLIQLPILGTFYYHMVTRKFCHALQRSDRGMADACYEAAHLGGENGKYLYSSLKGNYLYMNLAPALKQLDQPIYIIDGNTQPHAKESLELYRSLGKHVVYEFTSHPCALPHLEDSKEISARLIAIL